MGAPFRHRLRVRYSECDAQGVVFNANYLTYFDVAFTELWREALGSWDELVARGLDMVVAEASVRYRAPVRFDDEIDVEISYERIGNTQLVARLAVLKDGRVTTEGSMRHVMIDTASGGKAQIPDDVRRALEPYLVAEALEAAG